MSRAAAARTIELAVDAAAAAIFAVALGFALIKLGSGSGPTAIVGALAAFIAALAALRRVTGSEQRFPLPAFEPVPPEFEESPELLLTDEQKLVRPIETEPDQTDELLLDDVLASLDSDSRVVRLFEPEAMPTAGELQANIERHLRSARTRPAPPDASQALSEALADLRRSLR